MQVITENFSIGSNSEITLTITPDEYEICYGETLTVEAPNNFENYIWSNGTQGNILETDNPGYYNVTATDANGCEIESNFILIEELPLPNFNDILGNTEIGVNENSVYYTQPNEDSTF